MKRLISIMASLSILTISVSAFAAFVSVTTVPNQAKVEILSGKVRPATDVFKIVLKTKSGASTDTASIGSYSTTGELATASGYTQGGATLSGCAVTLASSTANLTCNAGSWTGSAAVTFDAVEIYDATCATNGCLNANQVIVLAPIASFTSATVGPWTVTLPAGAISIAIRDVLMGNSVANLVPAAIGSGNVTLPPISMSGFLTGE